MTERSRTRAAGLQRARSWLGAPLFWITLGALVARTPAFAGHPVVLTEGTTYVTIARNLLGGHGYVGILGTVEPFVPPLYPWLIALGTLITRDGVLSARLISLVAGTALVPATYFLAQQLFDHRCAAWSALLVAGTPLLIQYSALEWSETLYALLLVAGLALGWRARVQGSWRAAAAAGLCLGAAYLTRIEGALVAALVAGWLVAAPAGQASRRRLAAALLLALALLAAPYVVWLSTTVDRVALESKSAVNFLIADRMASGMDYVDAAYGLDSNGGPGGPFLARTQQLRAPAATSARPLWSAARLSLVWDALRQERVELQLYLLSTLMLVAVAAGMVATLLPAARRRARHGSTAYLGSVVVLTLVAVALVPQVYTRYLVPLFPLFCVWAGAALVQVDLALAPRLPAARGTFTLVVALVLLLTLPRSSTVSSRRLLDADQQRAGEWLAAAAGAQPLRILAVHSQIPFYARGIHVPMPNGAPQQVLAYAASNEVNVIVTSPRKLQGRPKLVDWQNGQPLPAPWHVVYRDDTAAGGPLELWER